MSSLFHLDQLGFIAYGCAVHNIRNLCHVMSEATSFQHPTVVISLDPPSVSHTTKALFSSNMHTTN